MILKHHSHRIDVIYTQLTLNYNPTVEATLPQIPPPPFRASAPLSSWTQWRPGRDHHSYDCPPAIASPIALWKCWTEIVVAPLWRKKGFQNGWLVLASLICPPWPIWPNLAHSNTKGVGQSNLSTRISVRNIHCFGKITRPDKCTFIYFFWLNHFLNLYTPIVTSFIYDLAFPPHTATARVTTKC